MAVAEEPITTPSGYEFHYDDAKHKYKLNGKEVPSVTKILGILDKPALVWWAQTQTIKNLDTYLSDGMGAWVYGDPDAMTKALTANKLSVNHTRDSAGVRGQGAHDALETLANTGKVPDLSQFPQENRGYAQAVCSFWLDHMMGATVHGTEVICGSLGFGFAGRYDLKAEFNGVPTLIDLKTSRRVYTEHHLQLAAYRLADTECGYDPPAADMAIVRLDADGTYEVEHGQATEEDFLDILEAYTALKDVEGRIKKARKK